jgi:hypothetical protein
MPVFLDEKTVHMWLDRTLCFTECEKEIEKSNIPHDLIAYQVSDLVNSLKNQEKECILPRKEQSLASIYKGLGRFFKVGDKEEAKETKFEVPKPHQVTPVISKKKELKNKVNSKI